MMKTEQKEKEKEKEKDKIVQEFKTIIDFYRMEYSDDLLALFNEFGCLLLCRLFFLGYFKEWAIEDAVGMGIL